MFTVLTSIGMFDSVTSAMLMPILDEVIGLIPTVIPAVIGFMAFRKGWSFFRGAIKGA